METSVDLRAGATAEVRQLLEDLAQRRLVPRSMWQATPLHQRLKPNSGKADRSRALKSVEKLKLPHDIQARMKPNSEPSTMTFSEESMAKARDA